jgi:hypothetical protein
MSALFPNAAVTAWKEAVKRKKEALSSTPSTIVLYQCFETLICTLSPSLIILFVLKMVFSSVSGRKISV